MTAYKHTQIGYLMLVIALALLIFFAQIYITSSAEPKSADSGPNFAITATMALILFIIASFSTLTASIDENYLQVKFSYEIFTKMFPLNQIASVQSVKNRWYYGWGVKIWFWPYMWIYNVSGFDAVEITMKDGKIYRIGTDTPGELEAAIKKAIGV